MRLIHVAAVAALCSAFSASAADRNFPVSDFSRITLAGFPDVHVVTGKAASVRATGDARDLDRLEIVVKNGELRIGTKNGKWEWKPSKIELQVTVPTLSAASITGSGDMDIDRVKAANFDVAITGSGDLSIGRIESGPVNVSITGSGDLSAGGQCTALRVSVTGSGDADIGGLRCQTANVRVMGSGDVSAYATGDVTASTMGSGDISIKGAQRCTKRTTGSGTITC